MIIPTGLVTERGKRGASPDRLPAALDSAPTRAALSQVRALRLAVVAYRVVFAGQWHLRVLSGAWWLFAARLVVTLSGDHGRHPPVGLRSAGCLGDQHRPVVGGGDPERQGLA